MKSKEFDINNNDMEDINIKHSNLKLIMIFCLLLSTLITIIHNIHIDLYIRDIIIPYGIMLFGYILLMKKVNLIKNKESYILLIPITLILISDIVSIDESNKILNVLVLPVLMSIFFFWLTNKNYIISKESIPWIFKLFTKNIFSNLKYIKKGFNSSNNPKTKMILNIIFGSLIGIPIATVLLLLLADADKYFSEFIDFILNFISTIFSSSSILNNILIIVIAFILLFSIFINIIKNKNAKVKESVYRETNITITSTILIIINSVFVLFLISEISKLTINFLQLPIEYTYAEYAREGFFQLLMVTSINFVIISYYMYYTKIIKDNNFIKKMLLLLIIFSIILIFNSYYRMFLYIGAYGFTILRLQVILFLAMELILFSLFIKKIIGELKYDVTLFATIVLFYILNIYLCTDSFIKLLNRL